MVLKEGRGALHVQIHALTGERNLPLQGKWEFHDGREAKITKDNVLLS